MKKKADFPICYKSNNSIGKILEDVAIVNYVFDIDWYDIVKAIFYIKEKCRDAAAYVLIALIVKDDCYDCICT